MSASASDIDSTILSVRFRGSLSFNSIVNVLNSLGTTLKEHFLDQANENRNNTREFTFWSC